MKLGAGLLSTDCGLRCRALLGRYLRVARTVGLACSEHHHDVALVDEAGELVAKRRISDDAEGCRHMVELLAEAGDTAEDPILVAIETARGLLICRALLRHAV